MNAKTPVLSFEEYQEKVAGLKTADDAHNFLRDLIAPTLQTMLEAELDHHLGYKKHDKAGYGSGNSRNGHYDKNLKTRDGTVGIAVPRDRNATFEPQAIPKYETVDNRIEERIVSLYGKGMTTGDIGEHMRDLYGVEVSKEMVSHITDKVMPLVEEWRTRPLSSLYPILYLDAVHFKVREGGKIVSKASYVMPALISDG